MNDEIRCPKPIDAEKYLANCGGCGVEIYPADDPYDSENDLILCPNCGQKEGWIYD